MVFIENGGSEQIKEEINAYKSLVPNGKELVATVMVEIDNPLKDPRCFLKWEDLKKGFQY